MQLNLEHDKIIWPGETRKKPSGLMIPTHLQVLTINETPFVYSRSINPCEGEGCSNDCDADKGEIPCPIYNTTHIEENGRSYQRVLLPYVILDECVGLQNEIINS